MSKRIPRAACTALLLLQAGSVAAIALLVGGAGPRAASQPANAQVRIEPPVTDLGRVGLYEKRRGEMRVYNDGDSPLRLWKPGGTCGCVSATLSNNVVPPHGSATLSFLYASAGEPKAISQKIILESPDAPGRAWRSTIIGNVEADVWASPSKVEAVLSRAGAATCDVAILCRSPAGPFTALVDSEAVRLEFVSNEPQT